MKKSATREPGTALESGKRQPYVKPRLIVHGDFTKLTRTKAGMMMDGVGKPMTRVGGTEC